VAGAILIVNPSASGVTAERVDRVASELGVEEIWRSQRSGHATELARTACEGASRVYVFSGDGGYNEVLNGADASTVFGFVPGGGTNVLPRALGLPREPVEAARRLRDGRTRRISLGRANGRRFAFAAGIGLDAELLRRMEALGRSSGRREHDLRVAWIAVRLLAERRVHLSPELEVVGMGRAAFALVANADPYSYLGPLPLHVAPDARFELGLDLIAPREVRPAALPRFLSYVLFGRGQTRARDILYRHDVDRLDVVCDRPLPMQVDGEDLGDVDAVTFEAERHAVDVLVPR